MSATLEVRSPYSGEPVGTLPLAGEAEVHAALGRAVTAARAMAQTPAYERAAALHRAAAAIDADAGALAALITAEQGKTTAEATAEAQRIGGIVRLCAEEAGRLTGEVLPMDAAEVGVGRLGYTRPTPTGVVAAITPFNYPAILVIHKVGPALAAGNAVVLKPALATPLTARFLVERLAGSGLPPDAVQLVAGPGGTVGQALCADPRVRKVSFTGSFEVGEAIAKAAGVKRITCELGSNAAAVVLEDADLERAAAAIAFSGFTNAGQNCVSTQRVIAVRPVQGELVERIAAHVDAFELGDPADPRTNLAPVIDEGAAERVVGWLEEARCGGGRVVRGGSRSGRMVEPALVVQPELRARVWQEELFGPAVAVREVRDDDEALGLANDTRFGLAASVFTASVDRALRFAHGLEAGIVNVNPPRGSTWRADFMPWGGIGDSGFGREGVRYATRDMTEERFVVVHPEDAG